MAFGNKNSASISRPGDQLKYSDSDGKLKSVEQEANDDEIKAIRTKLEELFALAKDGKAGDLSKKTAEIKSSFIKVYMKRG
jgi:hypothetical protein